MKRDAPNKLEYAPPDPSGRTVATMLVDASVGIFWIVFGLIGGFIAVVLTDALLPIFTGLSAHASDVPDEPFRWVAAGLRRIFRGRQRLGDQVE